MATVLPKPCRDSRKWGVDKQLACHNPRGALFDFNLLLLPTQASQQGTRSKAIHVQILHVGADVTIFVFSSDGVADAYPVLTGG